MIKRMVGLCVVLCVVFALYGHNGSLIPAAAQPAQDDTLATQTMALVNEWRMSEGLLPLRMNPVLQQMAYDQAVFILPKLASIQSYEEYHTDAKGQLPRARAVNTYEWPTYGRTDQAEIGENTAEFPPAAALNFWKNSSIHAKAALSKVYREAGIAALSLGRGRALFVLVMGARPKTYPVLFSASRDTLYLYNENPQHLGRKPPTTTIQVFDSLKRPITPEAVYQPQIKLAATATETLWVRWKNGRTDLWIAVDPKQDVAILPGGNVTVGYQSQREVYITEVEEAAVAVVPTAAPTHTPTVEPTLVPPTVVVAATSTPRAPAGFPTNTPRPSRTPAGQAVNLASPTALAALPTNTPRPSPTALPPTPTLTPDPGQAPDLLIVYNPDVLFVVNVSGRRLSLTSLQIGRIAVSSWKRVADFPDAAFPSGQCLQINALRKDDQALPRECTVLRAQISGATARMFWMDGPFSVLQNNVPIATCPPAEGVCRVKLQ